MIRLVIRSALIGGLLAVLGWLILLLLAVIFLSDPGLVMAVIVIGFIGALCGIGKTRRAH